jgi:predicted esterase
VRNSFFPVLVIAAFFVLSCNSSQSRSSANNVNNTLQEKGKVIPDTSCLKDQTTRYSLYLPSGYTTDKKYPLILAFDPHASGNLPVEKYHELAEQYGYILMGSNNSKNGQRMAETQSMINSMFEEIRTRYSVDTSRIYLMGFSGGARIASLIALYAGGIRGVIGCGAGFPGSNQPGRFRFDYIGMAGNADFNMNELVSLDEQLEQQSFRHALIIFDGKHEWPEKETMEEAFFWTEFCAMKDNLVPKNKRMIEDYQRIMEEQIRKDETLGNIYKKSNDLKQLIRFLDGLSNLEEIRKQLKETQSSQEFIKAEKDILVLKEKEMQEQQMFAENFYLKDMDWWKNRITNYKLRITNKTDTNDVLMCKRVMSYLSLLAYMKYTGAINTGDKEKADFALKVYQTVDPENASKIK